jgi:hypothetical protein
MHFVGDLKVRVDLNGDSNRQKTCNLPLTAPLRPCLGFLKGTFKQFRNQRLLIGRFLIKTPRGYSLGSYLGKTRFESRSDTGCTDRGLCGFLQFLQANAMILPLLGHDHFIPNCFQFIVLPSSYRVVTDSG